MICSLNLDLSSFLRAISYSRPLTTQLTLLNKNSEDNIVLSLLQKSVFKFLKLSPTVFSNPFHKYLHKE
jgi:hypothetical protein